MEQQFPRDVLDLLDAEEEIEIETVSADNEAHRAIIWIVVDGDDVFVRSVRGPRGRWFRELSATSTAVVHARGRRIPVRAVPATDSDSVKRCSDALVRKYPPGRSVDSMLVPDTLPTTLRLQPA